MMTSAATSKVSNNSGIVPMQFKVVVEVEKSPERTNGGIYVPEQARDRKQFEVTRGVIVAAGPAAFSDHDQYPADSRVPQVGDAIWFDKHAGTQMKRGRDYLVTYRVIEDTDIVGICVDEQAVKGLVA